MATVFMNLSLPTPTVTLGPEWATELNTAIETIDSHDHTSGKGQKIPTAGLNINEDLDFLTNRAFNLEIVQFDDQSATLTGATNANAIYTFNGNLYFTNSSGVAVQLTSGGSIVSSPTSSNTYEAQVVNSNLTIAPGDTFVTLLVDTSASRQIDLPLASAVATGRIFIIKDTSEQANSNNITIATQGSDTIEGDSSFIMNSNEGSVMITGNGVSSWYIV